MMRLQLRASFSRMQSYATFRISETIRIVLFMALSILLLNSYPVTAIMIIILALVNDIPVMAIAYDNAPVHHAPEQWHIKTDDICGGDSWCNRSNFFFHIALMAHGFWIFNGSDPDS